MTPTWNESPEYDSKQSDGEAPVLDLKEMWGILLLLLPGSLWLEIV